MLVAARTATPVRANEYRLEAAAALLDSGTPVGTILDDVDTEVAGPELASRSRALRVHHARLEVAVPSSVWRTQVSFVKADLVKRINEHIGSPTIKDIRLVSKPATEDPFPQGSGQTR